MHIDFPAGHPDGLSSCTLERFAGNAVGVLLEDDADPETKFLLGTARYILPGWHAEPDECERSAMGMAEEDACVAYCRVCIPSDAPGAPGFDFNRLIMVCPRTGLAVEKELSGQPVVPFAEASKNSKAQDPLS